MTKYKFRLKNLLERKGPNRREQALPRDTRTAPDKYGVQENSAIHSGRICGLLPPAAGAFPGAAVKREPLIISWEEVMGHAL